MPLSFSSLGAPMSMHGVQVNELLFAFLLFICLLSNLPMNLKWIEGKEIFSSPTTLTPIDMPKVKVLKFLCRPGHFLDSLAGKD